MPTVTAVPEATPVTTPVAVAPVTPWPSVSTPAAQPKADPAPSGSGESDHYMFGGSPTRNMVNLKDKVAKFPTEGPKWDDEEDAKKWTAEWVLWKADLGSRAYGGPTIAGGRVYVGTNNENPRNPRDTKKGEDDEIEKLDKGVLMVFAEKDGHFLWQHVNDKLPNLNVTDWPKEGLCATPTVEGDRVYYVSNRCTITCANVEGRANGVKGIKTKYETPTDADIIWEYDLIKNEGVFPHNMSAGCPLIVGDLLYTVTANGVDESHINLPSPTAPSFIALEKKTGKLKWKSNLPGKNIMHGQWSNPAYAEIDGVKQVIFPGGDGWLYSFVPETGELIWKFDANPKDTVYELGGTGNRSDFIGTPVIYDEKIYIGVGQDPEHSTGIANFYCIAPKKTSKGDISKFLETSARRTRTARTSSARSRTRTRASCGATAGKTSASGRRATSSSAAPCPPRASWTASSTFRNCTVIFTAWTRKPARCTGSTIRKRRFGVHRTTSMARCCSRPTPATCGCSSTTETPRRSMVSRPRKTRRT